MPDLRLPPNKMVPKLCQPPYFSAELWSCGFFRGHHPALLFLVGPGEQYDSGFSQILWEWALGDQFYVSLRT